MSKLQSFESFNEEKKDKWIQDAIKKPGSLKKSLGKDKDEKITKTEIEHELSKLKAKDKDKKKPGTQLDKKDATKKRRLELAKTLKSIKENHEGNYMFFSNLETIKRLVDELLEMDRAEIDTMLNEHDWASDHITSSKDDIEEVFDFIASHSNPESLKPLLGGPKSSHTDDEYSESFDILLPLIILWINRKSLSKRFFLNNIKENTLDLVRFLNLMGYRVGVDVDVLDYKFQELIDKAFTKSEKEKT
jgi:hypothetical protein